MPQFVPSVSTLPMNLVAYQNSANIFTSGIQMSNCRFHTCNVQNVVGHPVHTQNLSTSINAVTTALNTMLGKVETFNQPLDTLDKFIPDQMRQKYRETVYSFL
jgi:hypothetical protein